MPQQLQLLMVMSLSNCPSECPIVRLSRQFASRPTQSHQRATNNVKLSLYNFSRGKPGGGKCRGRQLRRLPWRPKLSAVCEQLETYESCLPNNNKINCARRGEKGVLLGVKFSGGRGKGGSPVSIVISYSKLLLLPSTWLCLGRVVTLLLPLFACCCLLYVLFILHQTWGKVFKSFPFGALRRFMKCTQQVINLCVVAPIRFIIKNHRGGSIKAEVAFTADKRYGFGIWKRQKGQRILPTWYNKL